MQCSVALAEVWAATTVKKGKAQEIKYEPIKKDCLRSLRYSAPHESKGMPLGCRLCQRCSSQRMENLCVWNVAKLAADQLVVLNLPLDGSHSQSGRKYCRCLAFVGCLCVTVD